MKLIGIVKSKSSGIIYKVSWNPIGLSLWINKNDNTLQMIGENIGDEKTALRFAQSYIDSHSKIF